MNLKKYLKTAQTSFRGIANGGLVYMIPDILIKLVYLIPLMFLWRVLSSGGVEADMTLEQLLTYTYINALFADMLNVETFASSWNYEGQLLSIFSRPMPIFGQIIAHTVGLWMPKFILFSLPLLLISPLFGINAIPKTIWFVPSLFLCISLGFAMDFIFACLSIRLRGMAWLGYSIRMAAVSLLSGTVIPFKILPFGLTEIFEYQPFGSLGGAPLSLFVGTAEPVKTIAVQIAWNVVMWTAAAVWFNNSREKLVSYGG